MAGNPNHDSKGRFASTDGASGPMTAKQERVALRMLADKRKFEPGRQSNRNVGTKPSLATRFARHQAGGGGGGGGSGGGGQGGGIPPHMRGVHNATRGKTLAEVSAMPTQQTERQPTRFAETTNAQPARR